ncbi:MAG: GNAT family N-acetyltransferase [Gordonia sp. (in: high G+C Gram-positive bacteria)]
MSHVMIESVTDPGMAPVVAELAAATFPLACPPHSTADDIAAFIADHLGPADFRRHIESPDSEVLLATGTAGTALGYCLIHHTGPTTSPLAARTLNPDVASVIATQSVTEVSKMYVRPEHHARGRAGAAAPRLMAAAIDRARARGSVLVWLGVNEENVRAQRFYAKMGFTQVGTKSFDLNGNIEHDWVLSRPVPEQPSDRLGEA